MPAGLELGITANAPYGTSTGTSYKYFTDGNDGAVPARNITEVPKFAALYSSVFKRLRIIANAGGTDYGSVYPNKQTQANQIWALGVKAFSPSTYILYGDTNNNAPAFNPQDYARYLAYLQSDAQWAQDNGMDAFCIGNENLISGAHTGGAAMAVATLNRTSNVATATFAAPHGLTTGDYIFVSGATPSNFNVTDSESVETVQCTVVDATTVTYPSTGSNGAATGTIKMNWSALEVVRKTKALGAAIQPIFTRGPIQYTESQGHQGAWIVVGITPGVDIDLIGINAYGSGTGDAARYAYWKNVIDTMWAAFGSNLIITEHNVVQDSGNEQVTGLDHRNPGFEIVADTELIKRYEYAKNLGITQIYLFGTGEYGIFCNVNPAAGFGGSHYDDSYWIGEFKAVVDKLRGKRISRVLIGNNTLT